MGFPAKFWYRKILFPSILLRKFKKSAYYLGHIRTFFLYFLLTPKGKVEIIIENKTGELYMKKTVLVLFLFCLGISVFSQEQISVFQSNSLGKKDMLVHTTFLPGSYRFSSVPIEDGILTRKDLYKTLLIVPENEKFVKRAKAWNIGEIISAGVFAGAAGYFASCLASGHINEDQKTWTTAFMTLGFVYGVLSLELRLDNTVKAVDNYNLSVAGLPVINR